MHVRPIGLVVALVALAIGSAVLPANADSETDAPQIDPSFATYSLTYDDSLSADAANLGSAYSATVKSAISDPSGPRRALSDCENGKTPPAPLTTNAGWCYDTDDTNPPSGTTDYYPQGISSSADSDAVPADGMDDGKYSGHAYFITSAHSDGNEFARVSFVDWDSSYPDVYTNVALVYPKPSDAQGNPTGWYHNWTNVPQNSSGLHTNGIVWVGHYLYVPDDHGLRIFNIYNLVNAKKTSWYADGFDYALPQSGWYEPGANNPSTAYTSLDRSTSPPRLWLGEHAADARFYSFSIDTATGLLQTTAGVAVPSGGYTSHMTGMQGMLSHDGEFYFDRQGLTGDPSDYGVLLRWDGSISDPMTSCRWAVGGENLTEYGGNLWNATERLNARPNFGIAIADVDANC